MKRRPLVALRVAAGVPAAAALALPCGAAVAQTVSTLAVPAVASGAPPSPMFGMMQGLVGLVIVLAVIFAAAWLLKKLGPRTRAGGVVQVMGGASIGPREKVVVVRFAGRTLLLGVAPGQVSLLHAAGPADPVEDPFQDASGASTLPSFVDRLRSARSGA